MAEIKANSGQVPQCYFYFMALLVFLVKRFEMKLRSFASEGLGHAILGNLSTDQIVIELT